jgi:AraC family transcriptional regulator of adaptative response / DNA-3-methyladenine glycosylase II
VRFDEVAARSENGQTAPAERVTSNGVNLDAATCYSALCAHDERFDGVFFVGVKTTGIYCRPVCRARTPGRDRCVFYRQAAEAERDGFRACFRCRPELAPGNTPSEATPRLVRAAVARIEAGFLNESSLESLAGELGVTDRHLRRAIEAELGVTPVALAQSRRLALASQLLRDTSLPLAEVAFASGFASVRRFNALFRSRLGRPPSAVRRELGAGGSTASLTLRLDYRPPFDWSSLLAFLAHQATPGVELIEDDTYARTVRLGGRTGWIVVRPDAKRSALRAEVSLSLAGVLMPLTARLRGLFDLDAQPHVIAEHLKQDPTLRGIVSKQPGLRIPGAFDSFEVVLRAILGQQITLRAAATLSSRFAQRFGEAIETPRPGLNRLSPLASILAAASESDIAVLGLPGARARAVSGIARAIEAGTLRLERGGDPDLTIGALKQCPGIGDWTAHCLAMRVLGWPDAFPASDLGLRKALGNASPRVILERSMSWRPWRAYAALHWWSTLTTGALS